MTHRGARANQRQQHVVVLLTLVPVKGGRKEEGRKKNKGKQENERKGGGEGNRLRIRKIKELSLWVLL